MEPKLIREEMRGPYPKVTWHFDIVVTWQIKNVVIPLSQGLWTPNFAGRWFRMRKPHPQNHVTHQPRGHVTNQRCYTPLSQNLWISNLAGWWLRMKGSHKVTWHTDQVVTWQIKIFYLYVNKAQGLLGIFE